MRGAANPPPARDGHDGDHLIAGSYGEKPYLLPLRYGASISSLKLNGFSSPKMRAIFL
jgi:hypothetical protein